MVESLSLCLPPSFLINGTGITLVQSGVLQTVSHADGWNRTQAILMEPRALTTEQFQQPSSVDTPTIYSV